MAPILVTSAAFQPPCVLPQRTAGPLVDGDDGLELFAEETCAAACGMGGLEAALLCLVPSEGTPVQLLGSHGPIDAEALGDRLLARLGRLAVDDRKPVDAEGGTLVAVSAPAGNGLMALIIGRRDPEAWLHDVCLNEPLCGAVRIAGCAIRDRIAAVEAERMRQGRRRTTLVQTIHADVVQRMFGVSLALADEPFEPDLQQFCAEEVRRALADLRKILRAAVDDTPIPAQTRHVVDDLTTLACEDGVEVVHTGFQHLRIGAKQAAIARSVLTEAVCNARKHASPECIRIEVCIEDSVLQMDVHNDGARAGSCDSCGIGLQLASVEALHGGGLLEHGPEGEHGWRVRLVLPLDEEELT